MKIQLLCDNINSWMIDYVNTFTTVLSEYSNDISIKHKHEEVEKGDILILLSCERKFEKLDLNKYTLVVHESALPQGKGWSPLTWQVLEGKSAIPITLFQATEKIDSGVIYEQQDIQLDGGELIDELREKQAFATLNLIRNFVIQYPDNKSREQTGEATYYPKRRPGDSELDINKTIADQFNLLRVCDNERYPAFFVLNGRKYVIKILTSD